MTESQKISIIYHSLFGHILSKSELKKWRAGKKLSLVKKRSKVILSLKSKAVTKDTNPQKLKIAKKASIVLSKIPTVLFVGITGSLAMNNAKLESDIDLMIITKRNTLWLTRLIAYLALSLSNFKLRRPKDMDEEDKVCLNLWLDESALVWVGPKNIYIAHEIAQVIPLVNKQNVYKRWILKNKWIESYWPKAIDIKGSVGKYNNNIDKLFVLFFIPNLLAYLIQLFYMSSKITRETITLHKAFFHPYDWGEKILKELKHRGVREV